MSLREIRAENIRRCPYPDCTGGPSCDGSCGPRTFLLAIFDQHQYREPEPVDPDNPVPYIPGPDDDGDPERGRGGNNDPSLPPDWGPHSI